MNRIERVARTMPLPVKRGLKAAAAPIDRVYVALWRRRDPRGLEVPPLSLRSRVGAGQSIDFYVDTGVDVARKLDHAFKEAEEALGGSQEVLDWGCGAGRVAAPLTRLHPRMRLSGCDVDSEAIGWAAGKLSAIDFRVNAFAPPLPYPDESFDAVYSISILTHLTHESQRAWLSEVHRVLRPEGLALLTTCGPTLLRTMKSPEAATNSADFVARLRRAQLDEKAGFLFVPYARSRWNENDFPGIGSEYGLAFQTEAQVQREWRDLFEIERVRPAFLNHGQDLVVARKRS